MEKKMKKTRRGAIVFAACLIAGVAFCVSAEPLKEKDSSISKKKAVEIALTHAGLRLQNFRQNAIRKRAEISMKLHFRQRNESMNTISAHRTE